MFKKYTFVYETDEGRKLDLDFYVHSKRTRSGSVHRACVVGRLPRLDVKHVDLERKLKNDNRLARLLRAKVTHADGAWEFWPGQKCLSRLWDNLAKPRFMDMGRVHAGNPFSGAIEPDHQDILEPDALFKVVRS